MAKPASFFHSTGFKVLVFVAGSILIGAILAPFLYWGGKLVVEKAWIADIPILEKLHGSMDRARFSRYFNRALVAGALILLFPTLKWLGGREGQSQTMTERLQIQTNPQRWIHLAAGFLLGAIPLFLLGWFYVERGWYLPRVEHDPLVGIISGALFTAFAVSFLEEFLFRGALTSVFSSILRPWPLLISVAVFFALVHFLKPPAHADITEVGLLSGFVMLKIIFGQFGDWYFLAAEFAVLFAVGWVLGYARMVTGSLWLSIGLHAGWVFGVGTFSPLTNRNFEAAAMMPWLGDNLRVGLASTLVVAATGVVVWLWLRRTREPDANHSDAVQ